MKLATVLVTAILASAGSLEAQTTLHSGTLEMKTTPHPFRFSFAVNGKQVVGQDATAGILIAGEPAPQTNDVFVDDRGLVYAIDRYRGLSVLEYGPYAAK